MVENYETFQYKYIFIDPYTLTDRPRRESHNRYALVWGIFTKTEV